MTCDKLVDIGAGGIQHEIRGFGRLVGSVDSRESLQLTGFRPGVQALGVALCAFLDRCRDVHLASANSLVRCPTRRLFSARSPGENPRSSDRPWRMLSPSSRYAISPASTSARSTATATGDLPEAGRPVNQMVAPRCPVTFQRWPRSNEEGCQRISLRVCTDQDERAAVAVSGIGVGDDDRTRPQPRSGLSRNQHTVTSISSASSIETDSRATAVARSSSSVSTTFTVERVPDGRLTTGSPTLSVPVESRPVQRLRCSGVGRDTHCTGNRKFAGSGCGADSSTPSRNSSSVGPSYHGVRGAVHDVVAVFGCDGDDRDIDAAETFRGLVNLGDDSVEPSLVEFDEVDLVHRRSPSCAPRR